MKADAIEISLSPSDADTISYCHVDESKNSGRKQKFGKMRSFFTRPKSPKKASKTFDDDGDLSLVTTLSGVSHTSARYGANKPRAVGRSISPSKSYESGFSRARARGKSPVRFRDDVSLSSLGSESVILKKKGSGYKKFSKKSGKNALKSEGSNLSQNRDEIQTCTSIDSTTTSKEEHFELGVTITCVSELRENEINDPVIYMTSDSDEVSVIKNDAEVTKTLSKLWACVDINQLFESAFAKSDLDEMKKNIEKSSDHVVAVEESFGNIASNVVALAEKKREEELSSAEKIQLHSDVVSTLNVINKNVGELLARKASSEADNNVSDKVDRNLETNEKEVDVQTPVKPDEVTVQVGDGAIASEVPAEKTLDMLDSEVVVQTNSIHENSELSAREAITRKDSIARKDSVNLVACLDYYQSVDLLSDVFAGLQEAVNNKKNEGKPKTGSVQESKNIKSDEVEGEVTEPVAEGTKPPVVEESLIVEEKNQELPSANEPLMVDRNKQEEELIVAKESPIVEENEQDELQPTKQSRNINEDAEQNTLFELVYSLHTYFDHTELDEVIKNLSSCGATTYESEKTVPKNSSVTGDMSTSDAATTSDSDEAVVLEDLNNSPRVLVYEENRINFIDECFDTLDGVEYCTAVVNTACNPCTASMNVQDLMRDEIGDEKEAMNKFNVQDLMVDGIQDRKETVKDLTGE